MTYSPIVQEIYAAFGQGNIPAIFNHLSEDVEWEYGAINNPVPWLQHGWGHAAAQSFFAALQALAFKKFVPKQLLESGGTVVALVDLEAVVKTTGKTIVEEDEVHIWHFNASGKVIRFRHRVDTYQHFLAFSS